MIVAHGTRAPLKDRGSGAMVARMLGRPLESLPAFYFARNVLRLAIPANVLRARLRREFATIDDARWEAASARVDYYFRAPHRFDPGEAADRWRWSLFSKQRNYAFDLIEHLRWFDRDLRVAHRFGDDTSEPAVPTLVKARVIGRPSTNAILFKLNKVRHFRFVRDAVPFAAKRAQLVWRGKAHQQHRRRFLEAVHRLPRCDVGRTNDPDGTGQFVVPFLSMRRQLEFQFVASIEGNDVATNLKWILSSNSVCVMPRPRLETWFQEGLLEPGRHYVEVADDWSDVSDKLDSYARNPTECERITRAANEHCARFKDRRLERLTCLLVLLRYFEASGQIQPGTIGRGAQGGTRPASPAADPNAKNGDVAPALARSRESTHADRRGR